MLQWTPVARTMALEIAEVLVFARVGPRRHPHVERSGAVRTGGSESRSRRALHFTCGDAEATGP